MPIVYGKDVPVFGGEGKISKNSTYSSDILFFLFCPSYGANIELLALGCEGIPIDTNKSNGAANPTQKGDFIVEDEHGDNNGEDDLHVAEDLKCHSRCIFRHEEIHNIENESDETADDQPKCQGWISKCGAERM